MIDNKDAVMKITVGALLHDIGKAVQRQGGISGKHSKIGKNYLNELGITDNDILDQVRYHHGAEMNDNNFNYFSYITYIADNISSGTDRREIEDGSPGFNSKTSLASIFNLLNYKSDPMYYRPVMMQAEKKGINMPTSGKLDFDTYFYTEIVSRISNNLKHFNLNCDYINSLLEVLEATLSFVPSSTNLNEAADISLYDHVKLTAAIASSIYIYLQDRGENDYKKCLFKNEKTFKDEEFACIYSMDISGIQDFIYTIHSKNALKTLRARSFYLEIFNENLIDNILSELSLSRANLLYAGGGHFYMLLPNTDKTKEIVGRVINDTNMWLIKTFDTALYVAYGFSPCSYNSLNNIPSGAYKNIFENASESVSYKKLHRYKMEDIIFLNNKHQEGRECRICHKVSTNGDECKFCEDIIIFSPRIIDKEFFVVVSDNEHGSIPVAEGQFIIALNEIELRKRLDSDKNSNNLLRYFGKNKFFYGRGISAKLWVGDYSASKELSDYKNNNISRMGVLRLDVDDLGSAFTTGFDKKYNTIGRTATLSRQLSMFFKHYINIILHEKNSNVSIIYSGGDDVFLIGAWWDTIDAAIILNECFKKFTCDKLKISAGIGIFPDKYPVHRMAAQTGELESLSKNKGKNKITIFNNLCFTWDDFNDVIIKMQTIQNIFNDYEKGASFAYKMLTLVQGMKNDSQINLARLVYLLSVHALQESFSQEMYKWVQNEPNKVIAALYMYIYKNRKDGNHDILSV